MKTSISVIIPSYNGAHKIGNLLAVLQEQRLTPEEIIVVLDGSTDNSLDVVARFQSAIRSLKIIQQMNGGRSVAKNRGAREAAGDLLIFYDDDMRPLPDSLQKHQFFHQNNKNAVCGGNQKEEDSMMKTDIQHYKASLTIRWTQKYGEGLNLLNRENLFLTAANFSISKRLFFELGGFDERLTDAEDYEFAARAMSQNIPVYFDKSNLAWHDDFITCRSYISRQRQYNGVIDTLNQILPLEYRRKSRTKSDLPFWKRQVFGFFATKQWVKWIDDQLIAWMPKLIRYQIYDYVITGLGKYYPNRNLE